MLSEVKLYLKIKNNWDDATADRKVIYFPNYYPKDFLPAREINTNKDIVNIGCFGAIRLLKNHLLQAFGALKFADSIGKKLHFHVNAGRIEMKGEPVINNLRGLFEQLAGTGHVLINHEWVPHEGFIDLCKSMDIGLQATFSETFNIVGADLVANGIPLVGTTEIPWINKISAADPTDSDDIAAKLAVAYSYPDAVVKMNQDALARYADNNHTIWDKYFTTGVPYENHNVHPKA
jgi:glycosyltransferase involved in cell wall biosynthesis